MFETFSTVWAVDFEFETPASEQPIPVCMVAREINSGKCVRLFREELDAYSVAPYPVGSDSLVLAYYAPAEMACHIALRWPMPENVLDLWTEFRCLTNGTRPSLGSGLIGALHHFGLDPISAIA